MANKECPECRGTGWVLENNDGRDVARRCRCYFQRRHVDLIHKANIPNRYVDKTFANFETAHDDSQRDAFKIARKFVEHYPLNDVGLLFQGPCGVGKTHLAVAVINELIRTKNVFGYFCDFRGLIRSIQGSFQADSTQTESAILTPIFNADVLVLDELGAKRTSSWVEETIFYIINQRYNNRKLTIFTSNYLDSGEEYEDTRDSHFKKSDDALVDRIGVRLRSRIYEMCKIVNLDGDDYRRKIKQAGYRF